MWLYVPPECLPCAPEEAVWNSESDSLYQTLEQSVLWKSKPRQASSWKRGWKTDPLIRLLCGRIYGNPENDAEENYQTLCTHCHGFWHKTLARLGLPIAGRMPPLWDLTSLDLTSSTSSATE